MLLRAGGPLRVTSSLGNDIKTQLAPSWEIHPLNPELSPSRGLEGRKRRPHSNITSSLAMTTTSRLHPASIQKQFVRGWMFPAHSVPGCGPAWHRGCPLEAPRALHHILGTSHVPKTGKVSPPSPRSHACGGGQQCWEACSEQDEFPQQSHRSPSKAASKGDLTSLLEHPTLPPWPLPPGLQGPREKFIRAVCLGTKRGSGETWTAFPEARAKEKSSASPQ